MILSKREYKEYYEKDLKMTGIYCKKRKIIYRLLDIRFKFYKRLRKTEYLFNCKKGFCGRIHYKICHFRYQRLCNKLNWTIPINVFDKGLSISSSWTYSY